MFFSLFFAYKCHMKKCKKNQDQQNRKENIADTFKLPKDILLGFSILTAIGHKEIWIENYKGIIEYTEEQVSIQGKNGRIIISGKNLSIDYYSNEDMKIVGNINQIQYF